MNTSGNEVRQAIDRVNEEAQQLSLLGADLKRMVGRFRLDDEQAAP